MYVEETRGIVVEAEPAFVPEQSAPDKDYFFFAYRIRITNRGEGPARLMSRHWVITDGHGHVREVEGPGVVGHQPELAPGQAFEYSSFCPMPTPTGNMRGSYIMVDSLGEEYAVKIPLFFLRDLQHLH